MDLTNIFEVVPFAGMTMVGFFMDLTKILEVVPKILEAKTTKQRSHLFFK